MEAVIRPTHPSESVRVLARLEARPKTMLVDFARVPFLRAVDPARVGQRGKVQLLVRRSW